MSINQNKERTFKTKNEHLKNLSRETDGNSLRRSRFEQSFGTRSVYPATLSNN
jgi:hypothetical protein